MPVAAANHTPAQSNSPASYAAKKGKLACYAPGPVGDQ